VYIDDYNGEPVAMRKGRGATPTALLLQPVHIIDGNNRPFTYLPGSLVHLSASGDETNIVRHSSSRKLQVPKQGLVRPWSDVTGMDYIRQTPLAYNNSDLINAEPYAPQVSIERPWQAVQYLARHVIQNTRG
jgi:hypothetical protein